MQRPCQVSFDVVSGNVVAALGQIHHDKPPLAIRADFRADNPHVREQTGREIGEAVVGGGIAHQQPVAAAQFEAAHAKSGRRHAPRRPLLQPPQHLAMAPNQEFVLGRYLQRLQQLL